MLSISRNSCLGQWSRISLNFFGYPILTREKIIVGYKNGGGVAEAFISYKIFEKSLYQTLQCIKDPGDCIHIRNSLKI